MNVRPPAAAMSRSICSACSSPFWSIASTAEWSWSARAATTRSALVVLPVPVPPQEKMCCPSLLGSRGPSGSPVIGTYGSCSGHGRVRTISPWERMYTRSPGRLVGRGLPEPSPAQLVLAELLAGAQVGQPPSAREERAGRRAGGQRREDE